MSKREEIHYAKYNLFEKAFVFILSSIGHLFNIKKLYNKISTKYMNTSFDKFYCTSWKPEFPGYQYNTYLFNEFVNINFEDTNLMVSKYYDSILRLDYDDNYMIPKNTHQLGEEYFETL